MYAGAADTRGFDVPSPAAFTVMRHEHAPVTHGSPRSAVAETNAFRVTDAWFPPRAVLEPHTHDRSILSVMLQGSFDTAICSRRIPCTPMTWWTEPIEERHANYVGPDGARVVVLQPANSQADLLRPFAPLLDGVHHEVDPLGALAARRIVLELRRRDNLSELVIESEIMQVLVGASRMTAPRERRVPPWLVQVRELLHERFRERLDLLSIAAEVDVSPWHVARAFRQHFHVTAGEYARAIRLQWALSQLASRDVPLSQVALDAGFADQSHLTRECTTDARCSPAAYRKLMRDGTAST